MNYYDRPQLSPAQQTELARQSSPYARLKGKFGTAVDLAQGLRADSLVLGDVFDIGLLYSTLVQQGREQLLPSTLNLPWVAERAVENSSVKRDSFYKQVAQIRGDLNGLARSSAVFDLPIDLEQLMDNPFTSSRGTEFEISHYPGGISIIRNLESFDNLDRFLVRLTNLNGNEPRFYRDIFRETGLPVR